jgi:hypothetical protein
MRWKNIATLSADTSWDGREFTHSIGAVSFIMWGWRVTFAGA